MVQHLIEEYQWDIQLLLIKDLQTGLHIVPQLLLFHWDIVLHPQTRYSVRPKIKLLEVNSLHFSKVTQSGITQHGQPV